MHSEKHPRPVNAGETSLSRIVHPTGGSLGHFQDAVTVEDEPPENSRRHAMERLSKELPRSRPVLVAWAILVVFDADLCWRAIPERPPCVGPPVRRGWATGNSNAQNLTSPWGTDRCIQKPEVASWESARRTILAELLSDRMPT